MEFYTKSNFCVRKMSNFAVKYIIYTDTTDDE